MPTFEYAPAPESRAIVTIEKSYGLFVDGAFTRPNATFATVNPADETELVAAVREASPRQVEEACAAAARAFPAWRATPAPDRARVKRRATAPRRAA